MNWLYFLGAIIVFYIVFAPRFAAWFYRPVLFPRLPMRSHEASPIIAGIKGKAIYFTQSDDNRLCAWYFRNPKSIYTMLVSHGNLGNIETHNYLTEGLLKAGTSVFIYDYSGYGASTGLPDLGSVTKDAEAAYDYLVEQEQVLAENIVLYGESIGAAITSHLAIVRRAKAIICQSGFISLRRIATEKIPLLYLYPDWLFPSHSLHTLNNLQQVNVPLLIMHGEKDIVVPFSHAESLFAGAPEPKQIIAFEKRGHKDMVFGDLGYFVSTIDVFLQSLSELNTAQKSI